MAAPNFDANFLGKSKARGLADAFKPVDEGDYEMVCTASEIRPVKNMDPDNPRFNWYLEFTWQNYDTDSLDKWGKRKFKTWINMDETNFARITAAYEALYDQEWPEEGLDRTEFADAVKNAPGHSANIVLEVAPHYLAETNPKNYGEAFQNNIISIYSPVLQEASDGEELFTDFGR